MSKKIIRCTKVAVFLAPYLLSAMAFAGVVIIDANDGNSEVEVQQSLNANPSGTTFLLKGAFNFSAPVFVEKSDITILGDMVDDGNGKPGPEDTWNTVISGPFFVAFEFAPFNWGPGPYDVSNVTIAGINFKLPIAAGNAGISSSPGNCEVAINQYRLNRIQFENNFVQGGGIFLRHNANGITIDSNRFAPLDGAQYFDPVRMNGATPFFDCFYVIQNNNSITNNTFDRTTNIYIGINSGLRIIGNRMIGLPYGDGDRITLYQNQDVVVSDNYLEGDSTNTGILIFSNNLSPFPGEFSKRVSIKDNILVDMRVGVYVFGGLEDSTIKRNQIIQSKTINPFGDFGIYLVDNSSPWWPLLNNSSENFDITNNHIADSFIAGIVLNGETTGVRMVNNTFDNPPFALSDIALAPFDVFFGTGPAMCPAYGNKIITTNFSTRVLDGYQLGVCQELAPNEKVGTLNLLNKEIPPQAQEHLNALLERLVNGDKGRPQDQFGY